MILFLAILIIQGCLNTISQSVYSELTNVTSAYPSASTCGECHIDIYNEWKESKHSISYTSDTFRERTDNYSFKECLDCHAPTTVFIDETFKLRESLKEEGITCVVCHFKDGKFAGPIEHSAIVLPHPVQVRSKLYRSSELCGKCHKTVYEQWQDVSRDKKNCQECHMKEVTRKITQGTDFISRQLVRFEKEGKLRRHKFHLSEIENLEGAIESNVTIQKTENNNLLVQISITNKIPHNIPSGGFGTSRAILTVSFFDKKNKKLHSFEETFYKELKTSLKTDITWNKLLSVPMLAKFANISLVRKNTKETTILYNNRVSIQ